MNRLAAQEALKVGGERTLKLNGLGLRKKAVFKVYVGGLYLESPSKNAGAILGSDQAKASWASSRVSARLKMRRSAMAPP